MLTKNISLKSFLRKGGEKKIKERFKSILIEKNELFNSMSKNNLSNINIIRNELILFHARLKFRQKDYKLAKNLINTIDPKWIENIE